MSLCQKEGWAAVGHALPVAMLVLALYYYWFALADRYIVFLYYHDMGSDTSAFSPVTSSRYWMAGLVVGGIVLVCYSGATWLLGRLLEDYQPPKLGLVWLMCGLPLLIGLPLITMTANTPTLPILNAVQTTLAAVAGVGLALTPGQMAAKHPGELFWLGLDGAAMAAVLLSLAMLERVSWTLGRGVLWPLLVIAAGPAGAAVLLLITSVVRLWRRMRMPGSPALIAAGLGVAYLLLPAIHHIFGTDGYFYISNKDNFFSRSWTLQAAAWLAAGLIAIGVTRLRRRWAGRWTGLSRRNINVHC